MASNGTFSFSATGDTLIARSLQAGGPGVAAVSDLLQKADARFTNLEVVLHDGTGYPAGKEAGTYCAADPALASDLRDFGFNLFACANNHSLDWMYQGLEQTIDTLDGLGLVRAGIGLTLAEARSAGYLEMSGQRVALLAMTTTANGFFRATDPRGNVPGRPGVNLLRHQVTYQLPPAEFAHLDHLREQLGLDAWHQLLVQLGFARKDPEGMIRPFAQRFVKGSELGVQTAPNPEDTAANLRSIANARRQADRVIVSIHSHEMKNGDEEQSPDFYIAFARQCIEAGADAVVGHGAHLLRGMEIYRGRPIFYSLGNFVFESELMERQPQDYYDKLGQGPEATPADLYDYRAPGGGFPADRRYWESLVPICRYMGETLVSVELWPLTLGFGQPRFQRGRPQPATGEPGREIIERFAALSHPFGCDVSWTGTHGSVRLGGA